jgi:hypothetical protein
MSSSKICFGDKCMNSHKIWNKRMNIHKIYEYILIYNNVILLPQKQRLTGKDVLFLTRKRQYLKQGLFGFFYFKQYA